MHHKVFTYSKKEKLKSRKQIEAVFAQGKSFTFFPVKVFYLLPEESMNFFVKTGVGVSGKYFKKAAERNRIKRLLREAYRLEKLPLHTYLEQSNKQAVFFLLYVDKTLPQYADIKKSMFAIISKLIKVLDENSIAHT